MKKSTKTNFDTPEYSDLIDIRRRGTLILGEFRTGSHFLAEVCEYLVKKQHMTCPPHVELLQTHGPFSKSLDRSPADGYKIVIVNNSDHKQELVDNPHMIDDWVVIRLVPQDRVRWFLSWFFFIFHKLTPSPHTEKNRPPQRARIDGRSVWYYGDEHSGHYYADRTLAYLTSWTRSGGSYHDPALEGTYQKAYVPPKKYISYHNDTAKDVYEEFLLQQPWQHLTSTFWCHLQSDLSSHVMGALVPADRVYRYEDLAALANDHVPWKPNRYPDIDILAEMPDGRLVKDLLDRYSVPVAGKRRPNRKDGK